MLVLVYRHSVVEPTTKLVVQGAIAQGTVWSNVIVLISPGAIKVLALSKLKNISQSGSLSRALLLKHSMKF
jgi:hypothetical protein